MSIQSINPLNGKLIKKYTEDKESDVISKIDKGHKAWLKWKTTSFDEREKLLLNAAKILKERKEELAALMAAEMGKPLKEDISEIEKCALVCEYYAANGKDFLKNQVINQRKSIFLQ